MRLGEVPPGHGRLAYPPDYRTLEYLTHWAWDTYALANLWIGLDRRTGPTAHHPSTQAVWTQSDGTSPAEIRWAGGAPVQNGSKQCVMMDRARGG